MDKHRQDGKLWTCNVSFNLRVLDFVLQPGRFIVMDLFICSYCHVRCCMWHTQYVVCVWVSWIREDGAKHACERRGSIGALTTHTHIHTKDIVDIRLSAHPLKCAILLSAVFLRFKIYIKEIPLFRDETTWNQIEICSKHLENNKMINKNMICKSFSISYQNHVRSFAYF